MRLQFTIRRLLLATAAFAVVLGCFAPFDVLSIAIAIPVSCATFGFFLTFKFEQPVHDGKRDSSRLQAVLAGMRRGAIFGGRWMGVIVGILCAIGWAFMAGFVFCRWLSIGDEIWYLISWKGLAEGIFMTSLTIAVPTVIAAVFGALIMGIGGGVAYGRHSVKNEQEGRSAEETIQQP